MEGEVLSKRSGPEMMAGRVEGGEGEGSVEEGRERGVQVEEHVGMEA